MLFVFVFVSQHYYWSGRGRKRVSTWREPVRRPRKLGEMAHSSMEGSQRPSCQFHRADQLAPLQVPLQGACQFPYHCLCSLPVSFHQQLSFQYILPSVSGAGSCTCASCAGATRPEAVPWSGWGGAESWPEAVGHLLPQAAPSAAAINLSQAMGQEEPTA